VITALGTWGMRVPLSWILTQETSLGLAGVWVATVADWALRALLTAREVHRGNWLREELAS